MSARYKGADLHARLANLADDAYAKCPIPGCGRPTQAKAGMGLSVHYCRFHVQCKNRYGSHWKRNIPAATLHPYRLAAERFLKKHFDVWVSAALHGLEWLMNGAGPSRHPSEVKGRYLGPREKARASLARLREAEVPATRLLVAYLAVAAAIAEDPIGPGGGPGEYRRVQAAKAVFRLASGYHSVYGPGPRNRFDRYPRSSGQVLRVLGAMLEEPCEFVREQHLPAILDLKALMDEERKQRAERKRARPAAHVARPYWA